MNILAQACAILHDRQKREKPCFKDLSFRAYDVLQRRRAEYQANPSDPVALQKMVNAEDFCQKFVFLRDRPDREGFLQTLSYGVEGLEQGQFMTLICLDPNTKPPEIGLIGSFDPSDLDGLDA